MSLDLVEVLIPIPLMEKFSYLPPKNNSKLLKQGSRVLVPFGKRTLVGVVWSFSERDKSSNRKYKYIKEILDEVPLLDSNSINLAEWSSRYYHYPLGEIISYFFPPSLRKGKEAKFRESKYLELTSKGSFLEEETLKRAPSQQKLISILKDKKEMTLKSAQAFGISNAAVNGLIEKGFVNRFSRELSPYKKLENKSFSNMKMSKSSIHKLINFSDDVFLNEDYKDLISYYKKLSSKDECVMIFTNEVAVPYFLKKPTCSKFFLMYSATPLNIQNNIIKDLKENSPSYLIYRSDIDAYGHAGSRLKLLNTFIINEYTFFEKFSHWEIFKKK